MKIIIYRPIPEGFKIKTAQVVKKADGYYVTLTLRDDSVPTFSPDVSSASSLHRNLDNSVGIDMGLKDFLITSNGDSVSIPQFARKSRKKLLNQSVSRKKKGSNRRRKAVKKLSKHHQKIARQRKNFYYKTSKQLLNKYDGIGFEDLNIKGLAKTRRYY